MEQRIKRLERKIKERENELKKKKMEIEEQKCRLEDLEREVQEKIRALGYQKLRVNEREVDLARRELLLERKELDLQRRENTIRAREVNHHLEAMDDATTGSVCVGPFVNTRHEDSGYASSEDLDRLHERNITIRRTYLQVQRSNRRTDQRTNGKRINSKSNDVKMTTLRAPDLKLREITDTIPRFDGYNLSVLQFSRACKGAMNLFPNSPSADVERRLVRRIRAKLDGHANSVTEEQELYTVEQLISTLKAAFQTAKSSSHYEGQLANIYEARRESVALY